MTFGLREQDQSDAGEHGLLLLELLETAPTSRTWLARDDRSGLVVVHRVSSPAAADRARMLGAQAHAATLHHPSLISPQASWETGGAVWAARPHDGGVSLRRLAAVARLTPHQVAAIGIDTLAGVAALHAAGVVHGRLHPGNVLIGVDGRARIADMGLDAHRAAPAPRPATAGTAALTPIMAEDVAAAAAAMRSAIAAPRGRRGAAPAAVGGPLDDLIRGPAASLGATAEEARATLVAAAGEPSPRVHREIAALVAPLCNERLTAQRPGPAAGPPTAAPPPAQSASSPARPRGAANQLPMGGAGGGRARRGGGPPPPADRAAPAPVSARDAPAPRPRGSDRWARRRGALWVLPVIAVLVVAAVVAVRGGGAPGALTARPNLAHVTKGVTPGAASRPSPAVTPSPGAASRPSPVATPSPAAAALAPPPAPAAAAGVQGLSLSPSSRSGCLARVDGACSLRVEVRLTAHAPEVVSWDIVLVDACTGARSTLPGAAVTAPAGYDHVWGDSQVSFASGDPVTLYAVTVSPARAASGAMQVTGSRSC